MDKKLQQLFKLGILTQEALNQYLDQILSGDEKIKSILDSLSLARGVNSFDRNLYKNWTENWKISEQLIDYAVSLAKDKASPLQYLSKVLASWHEAGIKDLKEAKSAGNISSQDRQIKQKDNFKGRSYSKSELNALFQSIDEIDV